MATTEADQQVFIVIVGARHILDRQLFADTVSAEKYAKARCRVRHLHKDSEPCPYIIAEAWVTKEKVVSFKPLGTNSIDVPFEIPLALESLFRNKGGR